MIGIAIDAPSARLAPHGQQISGRQRPRALVVSPARRTLIPSLPIRRSRLAPRPRTCDVGRRVECFARGREADGDAETRPRASGSDVPPSFWARALGASAALFVSFSLGVAGPAMAVDFVKDNNMLFDAMAYSGRWYEVASLKTGFAGEGQQDCHCTQGVYVPKKDAKGNTSIEVNTFCVHGSPNGRISGIQGRVTCASPAELKQMPEFETQLEKKEMIAEKCVLRFPAIPFIPPETYDVIRTDYNNYAIVQGAPDTSFVQIYSRTPNPGKKFIEEQKEFLKQFGYPVTSIRDTPQDCPEVPVASLMGMMKEGSTMESMMTNTMPSPVKLTDIEGVVFAGPRDVVTEIKDFIGVLGKKVNG